MTLTRTTISRQIFAALVALVCAVLLPQACHMIGAALGVHSALGEILLPMHLPVLIVGFLAGPLAGALAGVLSPMVSAMITGMPAMTILPFMCVELCLYGLVAGLLKAASMPNVVKVLAAQVLGRLGRAAVILLCVSVLHISAVNPMIVLTSIAVGLPGIILQWIVIPVVLRYAGA